MDRHYSSQVRSQRQLKVAEEIRHHLSQIFTGGDIFDIHIETYALTVTEVRISPDLRNASVYIVPMGSAQFTADARASLMDNLRDIAPKTRKLLSKKVHLRRVPALHFLYDDRFDRADALNHTLKRLAS